MSAQVLAARRALCVALAVCVPLSGCGAVLFPVDMDIGVNCTNVSNALFSAPKRGTSARSGNTLSLDRREDYTIVVTAPGYVTQEVHIASEVSVWRAAISIVLNGGHGLFTLFITTVLGVGIDIKQGAWQCIEDTPIEVELVPGQGGPPSPAPAPPPPAASRPEPAPAPPPVTRRPEPAPAPPPPPPPAARQPEPAPASAPARSRFCTACGAALGPTTQFCTSCGAKAR